MKYAVGITSGGVQRLSKERDQHTDTHTYTYTESKVIW
jgi:hypothetical protein